jgi:uncharacterized protein
MPATPHPSPSPDRPADLVVSFDLDLTLLDSAPGIAATYAALSAELGVPIEGAAAVARVGIPLEDEIALHFPADQVVAVTARYRELYTVHALPVSAPMSGALAAVRAVRGAGGRVIVVTAKSEHLARACLEAIDLRPGVEIDAVVGRRYAETKGDALRQHGASIHVGDHPGDMIGALAGDAFGVGVATGGASADDLAAAGAGVILPDLAAFPGWLTEHLLATRLARLEAELRGLGSVLVAFSGGADSSFLLAAAARTLGAERVVAATAVSPSLPGAELDAARAFAADLGVRHLTPATRELDREGYRANSRDRCYFCKAELTETLAPLAAEHGLANVVTGTNADDAADAFRPGIAAAAQRGARTPLLAAGMTKAQVREASRRWGLSSWDKPAAACLASRIAYGLTVTPSRLGRVERAEAALRDAFRDANIAVRDLRVRDLGGRASVEVDREIVTGLRDRPDLVAALESLLVADGVGFETVEFDPRGFRSGSMNEIPSL